MGIARMKGKLFNFRSTNYIKVLNNTICDYTVLEIMKFVLIAVICYFIEN